MRTQAAKIEEMEVADFSEMTENAVKMKNFAKQMSSILMLQFKVMTSLI